MRAVVTVVGKDRTGIIATVSGLLYKNDVNILDITQTIMQDIFTMITLIDTTNSKLDFAELKAELEKVGDELGVAITLQQEDLFNSMHRI
ncbi:MAG: ACT domain-containing protein [Oscillospiraceae bacterium]|nr:ACT domain-containing protein [Oscillospiraceae bacterium]